MEKYLITGVRFSPAHPRISMVLWVRVDSDTMRMLDGPAVVKVGAVVEAIEKGCRVESVFPNGGVYLRGQSFEVTQYDDGEKGIAPIEPTMTGYSLMDLQDI